MEKGGHIMDGGHQWNIPAGRTDSSRVVEKIKMKATAASDPLCSEPERPSQADTGDRMGLDPLS